MSDRHVDVFFYGLFMDSAILEDRKVLPTNPRRGYVEGFALRIARRAMLVPRPGARAYGVVFGLTHRDLDRLYSAPGLEQYRPEAVLFRTFEGGTLPVLCYNLQDEPSPEEHDEEYAKRLRTVLTKLGFPPDYVSAVG